MKKPVNSETFGRHLRQLREARGWSQKALADVADIAEEDDYPREPWGRFEVKQGKNIIN